MYQSSGLENCGSRSTNCLMSPVARLWLEIFHCTYDGDDWWRMAFVEGERKFSISHDWHLLPAMKNLISLNKFVRRFLMGTTFSLSWFTSVRFYVSGKGNSSSRKETFFLLQFFFFVKWNLPLLKTRNKYFMKLIKKFFLLFLYRLFFYVVCYDFCRLFFVSPPPVESFFATFFFWFWWIGRQVPTLISCIFNMKFFFIIIVL